MAIRDVLLALTSYPEPPPVSVVENAVSFASSLGCHIAALACVVHIQLPGSFLSSSLANVAGIAASEANKSRKAAEALLAAFDSIASGRRFALGELDVNQGPLALGCANAWMDPPQGRDRKKCQCWSITSTPDALTRTEASQVARMLPCPSIQTSMAGRMRSTLQSCFWQRSPPA